VTPTRPSLGAGFGRLLGANLASSLADGIARTAAPLLAVRLTSDPLLVAGVAAVVMLPWLLAALPAGLIVDRCDTRRVLLMASATRSLLAALLVVLTGTSFLTIWWLYGILFVYGLGETLADGAIRAAVPSLVGPAELTRANSRIEAGEQVLQGFAAAPLTSALFAVSALIPLGLGGAAFALAAGLALALPPAAAGSSHSPQAQRLPDQLRAGLSFLRTDRRLLMLWLFSTFWALCLTMGTSLVPLLALQSLGLPEALFGVLMLSEAIGGVLAAGLVERARRRWGGGTTMAVANVVASSALVMIWVVPQLWMLAAALFVHAAMMVSWNVLIMSFRQAVIPTALFGRVHGTWRTLHWGAMPLGAILAGPLGRVDVTLPFAVGGGAAALVGLALYPRIARLPDPEDIQDLATSTSDRTSTSTDRMNAGCTRSGGRPTT